MANADAENTVARRIEEPGEESKDDLEMDVDHQTEKEDKTCAETSTQVTRDRTIYDSVSEFIVRTCRLLPKSNTDVFQVMHLRGLVPLEMSNHERGILCGSGAEFFIQPLNVCIDDVDIVLTKANFLAFPDEKPVLPYDIRNIADGIYCYLMEPYGDYPAFVRLRRFGQTKYNLECKTFEFSQDNVVNVQTLLTTHHKESGSKGWSEVGPSNRYSFEVTNAFEIDHVQSTWCPQWPNEAKDWPFRRRIYGWPTTVIIHEVVQIGCHVVPAKHPACRNDEHQFRLSFSFAEVILLQSWTPIQQIVYHLLRFFAKRVLIKKDCPKEDEVLCTYHLKTLMLWSCEEMSPEWWNSLSVIELCSNLLEKLAKWLEDKRCRNYFIPEANLFRERMNQKIVNETSQKLSHFCLPDILCIWFARHYMQPIVFRVPKERYICEDVSSCVYEWFREHHLQPNCPRAISARHTRKVLNRVHECMINTCEAMKANEPKSIDQHFASHFFVVVDEAHRKRKAQRFASLDFSKSILRIDSLWRGRGDFLPCAEIESCLWLYGSTLRILYAAQLLDCKEMYYDSEWFVKEIKQISIKPKLFRSKQHNLPRPLNTGDNTSQLYFIKAQDLIENLNGSKDDLEFQVVSEIAKGLLRKALECHDSKTNAIAMATVSYMAALHFVASEYQIVIDLCSKVIMNEKPEKEDREALNAGCLLFIEDITKIIGFYLIFRKTRDASLQYTRRQFFLDLRLTPGVFAHYLEISTIEREGEAIELDNILQVPKFPLDAILMTIIKRRSSRISKKREDVSRVYQRTDPLDKFEAPDESHLPNEDAIIHLLMEISIENMTSFYNAIFKDFGIHCNTADCYRAAYLYQCRKYPEVLHLCERILGESDLHSDLKELAIANVMVLPPLDSFFDRDVQCLLGFHTLVCYLSSSNEYLWKIEVSKISTFQRLFAQHIYSEKMLLSMYLKGPYFLTRHYFLRRFYLARYLKVRCLIDCKHSFSEVMFEFNQLKASLPFECIIRCFLEQKLRHLQKVFDANYFSD